MVLPRTSDHDQPTLRRLKGQQDSIDEVFARHGYEQVDPPVIEPADAFLERSGEDIRRRMFVFTGPGGEELCLRPDLTIPTCRLFLRRPARTPARLSYTGPAFRAQPTGSDRPVQFLQSGVEFLGEADRTAADAEVLALAIEAVSAAGCERFEIRLGDVGLFHGFMDRLALGERWRDRLKRQFWRPAYVRSLLERLAGDDIEGSANVPGGDRRMAFLDSLASLGEERARLVVEEVLNLADIAHAGGTAGRSVAEIADRFLAQAGDVGAERVSAEVVGAVDAFFSVRGAAPDAPARIADIARGLGIGLDEEIAAYEARLKALEDLGVGISEIAYSADFGRNIEYYTGFVFELGTPGRGREGQIAGGGRYDNLLVQLGAPGDIPAVGCAIRIERLLEAATQRGGGS